MDWNYILSLSQAGEEIDDGGKDELLQTIAWHDFDAEKIDILRYSAVVKLCQTMMKYKSQQVDALLEELDEQAKKQGESQARMQESDERSSRSRKSLDSDEQDTKYRELKAKYRKLQKLFESSKSESEKLKESVKQLEQERVYLQAEIRDAHLDDTASDVSEIVKDQQKNLVESVQQKNAQISQLLTDIENVEGENLQMRLHLSSLRDEFADATGRLEALISENRSLKIANDETSESNAKMRAEIVSLKGQVEDLLEDKATRELEFDEFAKEIDVRIEDWKVVLETKNKEIEQLKSRTHRPASRPASSTSSSLLRAEGAQLSLLQQTVTDRDADIARLQKQLETATKEMSKTTIVLQQVTSERDALNRSCDKLNDSLRSAKKQLQTSHSRCQELIDDVQHHETLIQAKDQDISELIEKITEKNVKKLLKESEHLKSQKRAGEKKVAELVKSCNKLRTNAEKLDKENTSLRSRLGVREDDFVSTTFMSAPRKLQKKQVDSLRTQLETSEEEKLQYRLELQKLSRIISQLSQQLLELGETPLVEEVHEKQGEQQHIKEDTLLEENDALRKGLHEILASVQSEQERSSVREIRSETLESLLRALDAKHVSGWYHPAMRLQAEVHTLQGSNAALRGQLRSAREELEVYKEKASKAALIDCTLDSSNAASLANLNNHLVNVLKDYKVDDETNAKLIEKLDNNKKEFLVIQERVGALFSQYTDEKAHWESEAKMCESQIKQLASEKQCLEEQLSAIQLLDDPQTDEQVKQRTAAEAIAKLAVMNRKIVYMENVDRKYRNEIVGLKEQLLRKEQDGSALIHAFKADNLLLKSRLEQIEAAAQKFIRPEDFAKLQNDYDRLVIKQRETQRIVEDVSSAARFDLELLRQKVEKGQAETIETSLVKDHHKEFEKRNSDLVQKNVALQESVKALEDKLLSYVAAEVHSELERDHNRLAEESQKHEVAASRLQGEVTTLRKDMATRSLWSNLDQYELHSLRHLVVDLQATGDDKAVIARLSGDVVAARMSETEIRKRLDEIVAELATSSAESAAKSSKFTEAKRSWQVTIEALQTRNSHLESVIKQQRAHYLGCIPMVSQERLMGRMHEIALEKKRTQETLMRTEQLEHESRLGRETLESKTEILNELNELIRDGSEQAKALEKWFLDKTNIQLQELRCRRQAEFKEAQLRYALTRQQQQDEEIAQLEGELLQSLWLKEPPASNMLEHSTQTEEVVAAYRKDQGVNASADLADAAMQTDAECDEGKAQTVAMLRQQVADKQSQITFYEKHILDMQQKKELAPKEGAQENSELRQAIADREKTVFELQSLLKKDRDEHSLAAARFQDELRLLQARLAAQQEKQKQNETQPENPGRPVVEYYIQQVHALERHTMELQTSVGTLSSQLQASREECARWTSLAHDRLQSVFSLEEQHKAELDAYKGECAQWRNEVSNLQTYINCHKQDIADLRPSIEKELKEKDNRIHELMTTLRQYKAELARKSSTPPAATENFAEVKESLIKEQEVLRKRCEQLLNRERSAREEIRSLKGQLMKRPVLSARSDGGGSGKEAQQQRRIAHLEKEAEELRVRLDREAALNDAHRSRVNADFDRWSKQKHWQQQTERAQAKLRAKAEECEKLTQTCASLRLLVERMEREKHNLEVRVKALQTRANRADATSDPNDPEDAKLRAEIDTLRAKLEQQLHHSGALSTAVLQDKLQAQERKIAVLELSAKGGGEMRAELERLQNANLRLEAANLELQLDAEKAGGELPHLREQVTHLENYVAALQSERAEEAEGSSAVAADPEQPRTADLERTVCVLKRVVEKLQAENKRLLGSGGKARSPDRSNVCGRECQRARARIELQVKGESGQDAGNQVAALRMELDAARGQLEQKAALLEKIKILLQRAAVKEKALLDEVTSLKAMMMGSK